MFNRSVYLYGQLNDTYVYELHEFFLILIHRYNVYILGWMIILGDYIQAIRIWISECFTFRSTKRTWTTWMWIRRRLRQNGMDLKIGIVPGCDLVVILRRCRELFQMIETQITLVRHVHSVHRTIRRPTTYLQSLHWVYWYLVITCYIKKKILFFKDSIIYCSCNNYIDKNCTAHKVQNFINQWSIITWKVFCIFLMLGIACYAS